MRYMIRFRIGKRLGAGARYTLKDFCIAVVERYSLTEQEVYDIVTLQRNETFSNNDLEIKRVA